MRRLLELAEVDSTNAWLQRLAVAPPPYTSVRAIRQTAGRGRLSRSWFSGDAGDNLAFSITLPVAAAATARSIVPLRVAVAAHRYLTQYIPVRIKWPNDIYAGGKKLAGILCEDLGSAPGQVIAGLGLNVNATSFPAGLSNPATSLALELRRHFEIRPLWVGLVRALRREFRTEMHTLPAEFILYYNNYAERYMHRADLDDIPVEFISLLPDGRARVLASTGEVVTDAAG